MADEHWQNLKQIFHAALALPASERAAFVAQSSNGDDSLRQSIESLLKSHEDTDNFLDAPAYAAAAEMLVDRTELRKGQLIAHYKIISLLGEGGMGRVYLAEDTKLHRRVCLKFLSARFTANPEWLRRFEQEARAASALNNPNILTIYEIGDADGHRFIGTEFIEGQTLRDRLRSEIDVHIAIIVAIQIASALVAAHRVNIIHRDIKPENIMIRDEDGLVKVLDFGLAKMSLENVAPIPASEIHNDTSTTNAGVLMGTVSYMSPEQARGEPVDARTDIWSLGTVLYEMVSGQLPFMGNSSNEILSAILGTSPASREGLAIHHAPSSLIDVIAKALSKRKEQRYSSSLELLEDLRLLEESLRGTPAMLRSGLASGANAATAARSTRVDTEGRISNAGYFVSQVRRHRSGAFVVAAILLLTIVGGVAVYGWRAKHAVSAATSTQIRSPAVLPFKSIPTIKIKRFTTDGRATLAAVSPDGKTLVHVSDDGRQQGLWMRHVTTYSEEKQILPPADVQYGGLTFSPDGDYLYYVATENGGYASLYKVPAFGGASKKLIVDIDTPISFSPDGHQFVFDRGYPDQGEDALMIANADGTGERKLATRKRDYWSPAWSPDGSLIASRATTRGVETYSSVVAVQVNDGAVRPIGSNRWWAIGDMVWLRDGSGLVLLASEQQSDPVQIWYLSYPGGETHKITNDLNDYESIGLTSDSRTLVAVQTEAFANIWSLPHGETSRATQITFSKADGFKGISWAPDDRLVYESWASGNSELWSINGNGSNPKQLTTDSGHNARPVVSPDGKYVVFSSNRAGHKNIWRMDIDGGNLKQLTSGPGEQDADISPDGKWVFFTSVLANVTLWKISIDGGSPVQLTDKPSGQPTVSPDGKLIACNYMENGRWKVAVIPFEGGQPMKTWESFTHPNWLPFHWTSDGQFLAYIDQRVPSSLWTVPVFYDGPAKPLLDFKTGRVYDFAWSHGGAQLAVSRGEMTNDVVLISDFVSGN